MIDYPTRMFKDGKAWRAWLESHHADSRGIWIRYYRKASGKPGVSYPETLEEALCFGWIDGVIRRVDDETYVRKFTPRSPRSDWSEKNLRLVEELRKRGRMSAAGEAALARWERNRPVNDREPDGSSAARKREEIPDYFLAALEASPPALENFRNLAPGYRRLYLGWILDGKREDTRLRRAAESAERLRRNLRLGLK